MLESANTLTALLIFAIVTSITPGPNNFMVMAASAAFGWRRTLPHVFGIAAGFAIMIAIVVLGLGTVIETHPEILSVVRIAGTAWLLWLAWKLGRPAFQSAVDASPGDEDGAVARPLTFFDAAMFQWVNPKAWTMALGASAAYSGISDDPIIRAMLMAIVFLFVAPPCLSLWMLSGRGLSSFMMTGAGSRRSSLFMAGLVVFSALTVLFG